MRINPLTDLALDPKASEDASIQKRLMQGFLDASTLVDKWGFIRQAYIEMMPAIIAAGRQGSRGHIGVSFWDWLKGMTPIEEDAWMSIRSKGIPLYPQFPVFNSFVDFANPYHRIGLEMDGREWHDAAKDKPRDEFFAKYGWRIFRIAGQETIPPFYDRGDIGEWDTAHPSSREAARRWLHESSDGVIAAIDEVYFLGHHNAYGGECLATLHRHRLADFDLVDESMNVWEDL